MLSLLGLLAIQAAIVLAAIWPDERPLTFRMVSPDDAREIAEAVEQAPPVLRPAVVAATSNGATKVELLSSLKRRGSAGLEARPALRLEARFRHYAEALDGRPIEIQVRSGNWLVRGGLSSDRAPRGPIRLLIVLRSGEVLAIERPPQVLNLLASRYLAIALVAAAVLALVTASLFWQVVRPVARLAGATEALRDDMGAPDAPVMGAREIKSLAAAFNEMKQRIGGLVKERTRMLAAVAHDMRTYLTRLRLRAEHIADLQQRESAVADIEEMGRLIDDILLFAREDAAPERTPQVIDVRSEALAYVDVRRETGDDVAIVVSNDPLPCRCTPLTFRRILANLIDNAVRYGERARVEVAAEEADIVVKVVDRGPGVPPELAHRLTAPFERLESSRSRHSGGAGLGLSIVKGLAESCGGGLALENPPGGGLCAVVRLPRELVMGE